MPDYEWFRFEHSTNRELVFLDIPETPSNEALCLEMMREHSFTDEEGLSKHIVRGGLVEDRPGWNRRENPPQSPGAGRG